MNRRYTAVLLVLLQCFLFLSACSAEKDYTTYYFDYFDTFSSLTVYAEDPDTAQEYAQRVECILRQYHQLCDVYSEYDNITNLYTVNQSAGGEPVVVSPELYTFLEYCLEAYTISQHSVNIAFGPVLRLWQESMHSSEPALPSEDALREAAKLTDPSWVLLNPDHCTVQLLYPGMSLDVGALAKGYACQMAMEELRRCGCKRALLNAGGNIACLGTPPGANAWNIGIQNPDLTSEHTVYTTWPVKDACVVTSGDYERFFELDDVRYHHIIDPATLYPARRYHSVSVRCDNAAIADLLSTALFLLPEEEGRQLAKRYNAHVLYIYMDYTSSEN